MSRLRRKLDSGEQLVGWKIGGNDPGTRMRWGVENCIFGYLPRSSCFAGDRTFPISESGCFGVEPEIWIELTRDLSGGEGPDEVASAIGRIGLAAELIRLAGRFDDVASVIENNSFHDQVTFSQASMPFLADDVARVMLVIRRNGQEQWRLPATTLTPDLREIPAFIAAGLASRGMKLAASQKILSGVLTPLPIWVKPGDDVVLEAGELGTLHLSFQRGSHDARGVLA